MPLSPPLSDICYLFEEIQWFRFQIYTQSYIKIDTHIFVTQYHCSLYTCCSSLLLLTSFFLIVLMRSRSWMSSFQLQWNLHFINIEWNKNLKNGATIPDDDVTFIHSIQRLLTFLDTMLPNPANLSSQNKCHSFVRILNGCKKLLATQIHISLPSCNILHFVSKSLRNVQVTHSNVNSTTLVTHHVSRRASCQLTFCSSVFTKFTIETVG